MSGFRCCFCLTHGLLESAPYTLPLAWNTCSYYGVGSGRRAELPELAPGPLDALCPLVGSSAMGHLLDAQVDIAALLLHSLLLAGMALLTVMPNTLSWHGSAAALAQTSLCAALLPLLRRWQLILTRALKRWWPWRPLGPLCLPWSVMLHVKLVCGSVPTLARATVHRSPALLIPFTSACPASAGGCLLRRGGVGACEECTGGCGGSIATWGTLRPAVFWVAGRQGGAGRMVHTVWLV